MTNYNIFSFDNSVYVFGHNKYGQLGLGHNNDIYKPTLLMQDSKIKSICCGHKHSMILKENGELFVFGYNYYGQLGLRHANAINKPTLLMTNKSINFHQIQQTSIIWNHNNRAFYPKEFKERIYTFTLYLKRN